VAALAGSKLIAHFWLRPGNTACISGVERFLSEALARMPAGGLHHVAGGDVEDQIPGRDRARGRVGRDCRQARLHPRPRRPGIGVAGGAGSQVIGVEFVEAGTGQSRFEGGGASAEATVAMAVGALPDEWSGQTFDQLLFFIGPQPTA
jgi:hypothetical protein